MFIFPSSKSILLYLLSAFSILGSSLFLFFPSFFLGVPFQTSSISECVHLYWTPGFMSYNIWNSPLYFQVLLHYYSSIEKHRIFCNAANCQEVLTSFLLLRWLLFLVVQNSSYIWGFFCLTSYENQRWYENNYSV